MADPVHALARALQAAVTAAFGAEHAAVDPSLRRSTHADYQANAAMALGKRLGRPPREVAAAIVAALALDGICRKVEIAGPGFVNLALEDAYLTRELAETAGGGRLRDRARGCSRDGDRRLLRPQRREGDARRPPPRHDHRRRPRARARGARPPRDPPEPPRRLGHAVRHADRAHARSRRGRGLAGALGRRSRRVLPAGARQVRRRPGVRRALAPAGRAAAGRRRADPRALAAARARVDALLRVGLPPASA